LSRFEFENVQTYTVSHIVIWKNIKKKYCQCCININDALLQASKKLEVK